MTRWSQDDPTADRLGSREASPSHYRCVTCGLSVTSASGLLHVAKGHEVRNRLDVQQAIDDTSPVGEPMARRPA